MDLSSPDLSAAIFITKSISSAPRAALARISASLISVKVTPKGNAMTVAIFTLLSFRISRASGTYDGNMQTAAMPYSIASVQRRRISVVVPIGRSSVWSIYLPKSDFIQNPYVRKIAKVLGVIETEADDEPVGNLKAYVVERTFVFRVPRFF